MKKLIIFSFLVAAFMVSCNEADIVDNDHQVGISKVTNYPIMTIHGAQFISIAVGTAFTDPGASAEAGGVTVDVAVSGSVNTNTPGVYTITYTATNVDGFLVTNSRLVGVYNASAAANDFSGSYARSTNQSLAVWTKVAPGMYTVFNPGGAPGTNLTIHAFNPSGFIINVPPQPDSAGGTTSCSNSAGGPNITYNPGPPAQYSWIVLNAGYGASVRNFTKQ